MCHILSIFKKNIKYILKYRLSPPKSNSQTHPKSLVFICKLFVTLHSNFFKVQNY